MQEQHVISRICTMALSKVAALQNLVEPLVPFIKSMTLINLLGQANIAKLVT